jgi:hypothetical protein
MNDYAEIAQAFSKNPGLLDEVAKNPEILNTYFPGSTEASNLARLLNRERDDSFNRPSIDVRNTSGLQKADDQALVDLANESLNLAGMVSQDGSWGAELEQQLMEEVERGNAAAERTLQRIRSLEPIDTSAYRLWAEALREEILQRLRQPAESDDTLRRGLSAIEAFIQHLR